MSKTENKINNFIDKNKNLAIGQLVNELSWHIAKITGTKQTEENMIALRQTARHAILKRLY